MKYLKVAKLLDVLADTFAKGSEEWRILLKLAGTARLWDENLKKKNATG